VKILSVVHSTSANSCVKHTSSLFDCFCLLALIVDPPASLAEPLGCDSKAGRGILDAAGLLVKAGTVPRPLGVPLMVPLEAIAGRIRFFVMFAFNVRNAKR
jgi:hypothetical protein